MLKIKWYRYISVVILLVATNSQVLGLKTVYGFYKTFIALLLIAILVAIWEVSSTLKELKGKD